MERFKVRGSCLLRSIFYFLLFTFPPTYSNSPNYTLRLEGTIRVVETALSAGIG